MNSENLGIVVAQAMLSRCTDLSCSGRPFCRLKPATCDKCLWVREQMTIRTYSDGEQPVPACGAVLGPETGNDTPEGGGGP